MALYHISQIPHIVQGTEKLFDFNANTILPFPISLCNLNTLGTAFHCIVSFMPENYYSHVLHKKTFLPPSLGAFRILYNNLINCFLIGNEIKSRF